MENKTNYGLVFISAFAVSYLIIGILRISGHMFDGKLYLLCSISSTVFAFISILESFVDGLKQAEQEVLSKIKKMKLQVDDETIKINYIHEVYLRKINTLHEIKSILSFAIIVVFFTLLSTNFITENPVLADGLSLISFSLIFFDIAFKAQIETIIVKFNHYYEKKLEGAKNDT